MGPARGPQKEWLVNNAFSKAAVWLVIALVLFTVPLSFTFEGVSVPFIQLIMRGDILIIAPIVDLLFGRKVRWWS